MMHHLPNVLLFTKRVGGSRFTLYRDNQLNLTFEHLSTKIGIREAKVNLGIFGSPQELFIALTWSEKEDYLYVGEPNKSNLITSKAEQKEGKIRLDKDRALYRIGDVGLKVDYYHVVRGREFILLPTAKEIWDSTINRVNVLIDGCKLKDILFESTIVQQCIVMLVTGLEVYTKNRFLEMEKEGKKPNIEALMHEFAINNSIRNEVENFSSQNNLSLFESLVQVRKYGIINFQD